MFNVPPNSLTCMLIVLALLVLATTSRLLLKIRHPQTDYTELRQRIQSWWWMVAVLFLALGASQKAATFLFGFISFLALKEFLSLVATRHADRRVVLWAYLSIPFQYYWAYIGWYGMFIIFIPVYVFLFLPTRMVLIGETKGFIRSISVLHWSVMLTVFSISHLAFLIALPIKNPDAGAIGTVLFLIVMTQCNDVSQYIWGKLFGRHKIIPKVSPNKTWEGFVGGLVTITLVSGLIAPLLTPLDFKYGLLAGLIISLSGYIGDVVISAVKRDLQIKDSGNLIPGHGGILDRFDSLMYTTPLFFHFLYAVAY